MAPFYFAAALVYRAARLRTSQGDNGPHDPFPERIAVLIAKCCHHVGSDGSFHGGIVAIRFNRLLAAIQISRSAGAMSPGCSSGDSVVGGSMDASSARRGATFNTPLLGRKPSFGEGAAIRNAAEWCRRRSCR